jgi:hypothetical protein
MTAGPTENMDRNRMNKSAFSPPMDVAGWDPKLPFDLVVAYEDVETRNRALHLYDHLAQQLLDDYDFQCSWWKFDHLANAVLRQQAADAAVEAHMVILSIRAHDELPRTHRLWLDDWIPRRHHRKAALVVMTAGTSKPGREGTPVLPCLQNAARLARMDFFTHAFDLPPTPAKASLAHMAVPAADAPTLQGLLQDRIPVSRWGINE